MYGAGRSRITHPFATLTTKQSLMDPVRLACVKHAASVHPEPGSNSHVKVLIPVKIRLANFNRYYCCFGFVLNVLLNFKA